MAAPTHKHLAAGARRHVALTTSLAEWWRRHRVALLTSSLVIAVVAAVVRVSHGLARLVSSTDRRGGIDLRFRWHEVEAWFAGLPVYGRIETADYPPASYPMFWPFVGWTDILTARWIWAGVTVGLLYAFSWLLWRQAKGRPAIERAWIAMLPLAGYATHGLLVTGQVVVLALVPLLAGLMVLQRSTTLRTDLLGAALVLPALVKPTLTVPLVWIAFILPGRWRPAVLIVSGYAALTALAASYQSAGLVELFRGWLAQGDLVNLRATHGNLQKMLAAVGAGDLFLPVALAVIVATGAWVYRHRTIDLWLLIGVTALVARLLTYHRSFDDLLIVLPMVALFRIACTGADARTRVWAGVVLAAVWAGAMTPRVALADVSVALALVNSTLPVLWIGALGLLLLEAHRALVLLTERARSDHALAVAA